MAKNGKQKQKLLYIQQYLIEKSDENNPVTIEMIQEMLTEHEIKAERKSLYDDLHTLQDFGMDIVQQRGRAGSGYYLATRDFEVVELKLLMDTVQTARFLTRKKSEKLIQKLEMLCSRPQAQKLHRLPLLYGQAKGENESIYYAIDHLHEAIAQNCQISFQYYHWALNFQGSERIVKNYHEPQARAVSPWALVWDNTNYYLVAYDHKNAQIRHYRVDKMEKIALLSTARLGKEEFERERDNYMKKTFGMFRGREENIKLLCKNELIGVLLDRFGKEIMPIPRGTTHFTIDVTVECSAQFYGWLCGLSGDAQILWPEHVKKELENYVISLQEKWKSVL